METTINAVINMTTSAPFNKMIIGNGNQSLVITRNSRTYSVVLNTTDDNNAWSRTQDQFRQVDVEFVLSLVVTLLS